MGMASSWAEGISIIPSPSASDDRFFVSNRRMDSFDLHGRTALVTGGFSGLGRHFAQVLATRGARVALAGRRLELGRREARAIGAAVGREADVRAYAMDVTDAASVEAAFGAASRTLGLTVKPILLPFAESAIDVDKPADLELAERILRNSASYQPAIM